MTSTPLADEAASGAGAEPSEDLAGPYRRVLEGALGVTFLPGNRVQWLLNGREIFPAMLDAIRRAERSVEFVTFVYWQGEIAERFADALADRGRAGVRVRVVLDAFGAAKMDAGLIERMESAGVELRWFHPLRKLRLRRVDKRTHRKLLVCDDRVGFTGGVGIASEWEGDARDSSEWRETHARVEGPSVGALRAAFFDNWSEAGGEEFDDRGLQARFEQPGDVPVLIVRSNYQPGWSDMATLLRALTATARSELLLTTPYFFPDPVLLRLLGDAARRGVRVRVLFPDRHVDSRLPFVCGRRDWGRLLEAGAELWRYERTMLHAKVYAADGIATCVGSPNLNHRSLGKDAECCLVTLSEALASEAREAFERDLEGADRVTLDEWRERGRRARWHEGLLRLVGQQL